MRLIRRMRPSRASSRSPRRPRPLSWTAPGERAWIASASGVSRRWRAPPTLRSGPQRVTRRSRRLRADYGRPCPSGHRPLAGLDFGGLGGCRPGSSSTCGPCTSNAPGRFEAGCSHGRPRESSRLQRVSNRVPGDPVVAGLHIALPHSQSRASRRATSVNVDSGS